MSRSTSPLYLVTVVHNRRSITEEFARCVAAQTLAGVTLVLVDDGSVDGTAEAVRSIWPNTVVLRGDGNLWWAGGLQKGLNWLAAQSLTPEVPVAFMNDDTAFEPEFLAKAVAELRALPSGQFLVVPGVFYPSGERSEEAVVCDWARFTYHDFGKRPERIDCSSTRSLFMRWGDLKRVGGFHPTLLPHYLSDYEFTIRARRRGVLLIPAKTVLARFNGLTTGDHWKKQKGVSMKVKLGRLFSPRFSANPIHLAVYIWLACPLIWKVPSWLRVFVSTAKFLR